jgi:hypothetical protein
MNVDLLRSPVHDGPRLPLTAHAGGRNGRDGADQRSRMRVGALPRNLCARCDVGAPGFVGPGLRPGVTVRVPRLRVRSGLG